MLKHGSADDEAEQRWATVQPRGCHNAQMTGDLERAVEAARDMPNASDYTDQEAWTPFNKRNDRSLRREASPGPEPIDLGVSSDAGAPLPNLISNGPNGVLLVGHSQFSVPCRAML